MTAYFAILLGGFLCSAIGWVAGYACATLRHHWHHAGREGAGDWAEWICPELKDD